MEMNAKTIQRLNAAASTLPAAPRTTFVDRLIGMVRPRSLVERGMERYAAILIDRELKRSAYKASEVNRLNENWSTTDYDINVHLQRELKRIRARSRWLFRNNPHAAAYMNANINFVIGTGLTLQARVAKVSSSIENGKPVLVTEELDSWNDYIEDVFSDWALDCDASSSTSCGESFTDCQELAMRKVIEDGEVFIHFVIDPTHPVVPLRLEFIEPEALDENITEYNGNSIIMGVELDKKSWRPVAYWIRTKRDKYQQGGYELTSTRVPANRIVHAFKRLRPKQVRGIPMLAVVTDKFFQLDELTDAEIISTKIAACFSVFIESPDGTTSPLFKDGETHAKDADGNILATIEPGIIGNLPPGYKVHFAAPQKPSSTLGIFTSYLQRLIGAGSQGGLSYEAISRDVSKVSYASGRLSQQMDFQGFRGTQSWTGRKICAPVYREFLGLAVLIGRAIAPSYLDNPRFWQAHDWMPPGWNWGINPLQEVQAARESMRAGITTLADECAYLGRDWKTQLRTMQKIRRECARLGVTIEADASVGTISRKGDAPPLDDAQDDALNPQATTENP